jgi:hypothetical protein
VLVPVTLVVIHRESANAFDWTLLTLFFFLPWAFIGFTCLARIEMVRMLVWEDRIEVRLGIWPFELWHFEKIRMTHDVVVSIEAIQLPRGSAVKDRQRANWVGWRIYEASGAEELSAVAIITSSGKWLIGCDNPEHVARKLSDMFMKKGMEKS